MATKRRIGVRLATTEAARRQLMQPVACWEKTWVTPEGGPSIKVCKWVKTDKKQQFSDDEEEADEPLAPLPDEPEVAEGDEDMDQDEPTASGAPDATSNFATQEATSEPQTKPSSPTPPTLSLQQTEPILTVDEGADMLDASFKGLDAGISVDGNVIEGDVGELDMSVLGPDATFEGVPDLSQLDSANALLGGALMGDAGDPFVAAMEHQPGGQEAT